MPLHLGHPRGCHGGREGRGHRQLDIHDAGQKWGGNALPRRRVRQVQLERDPRRGPRARGQSRPLVQHPRPQQVCDSRRTCARIQGPVSGTSHSDRHDEHGPCEVEEVACRGFRGPQRNVHGAIECGFCGKVQGQYTLGVLEDGLGGALACCGRLQSLT